MAKKPPNIDAKIMQALRRASYMYSPTRKECLAKARVAYGRYICNHCLNLFGPKEIALDHIEPVVPVTGRDSWDGVVNRMMYGAYQALCKACHQAKSNLENAERRKHRKKKKEA